MDSVKVILDDNINISGDRAKLIRVGGLQTTYNNPQNNGSILGGQILFNNILLPSLSNSVISRNMRIRYQVRASSDGQAFVGVDGAGSLRLTNPNLVLQANFTGTGPVQSFPRGALRPFPLSACTDTATLTINSTPMSLSLRQVLPAILRTIPKEYLEKQASECPSQLDPGSIITPDDFNGNPAFPFYLQSSQPLSSVMNCPYGTSRASFTPVSYVLGGAGGQDVAIYEVCEPIFVPPLSLYDDKAFLANVQTLSYQINYSLLNDMFCYTYVYPSGFNVSLVDNSARFEYTTITLDSQVVAIPRVVSYDYSVPQFYQKNLNDFLQNYRAPVVQNTGPVYSDSLRLSYMPSLIYVYAGLPVSRRSFLAAQISITTPSFTDCNLALGIASGIPLGYIPAGDPGLVYNTDQTNIISIQLNNRQNLLAGASIKDLFRIACSNGYSYSYNQWLNNPIIIINPVKDLGLDISSSDIYPNQNGNVTLSIQAQFNTWNYVSSYAQYYTTSNSGPTAAQLTIVCLQDGICEISPDTTIYNSGCLSSQEVKASIETAASGGNLETDFVPSSVSKTNGGSLSSMFGSAPSVISGIAKGLGSVIDDPLFKMALKGAQSLGGGVSGGKVRRARKDKKDGGFLFGLL